MYTFIIITILFMLFIAWTQGKEYSDGDFFTSLIIGLIISFFSTFIISAIIYNYGEIKQRKEIRTTPIKTLQEDDFTIGTGYKKDSPTMFYCFYVENSNGLLSFEEMSSDSVTIKQDGGEILETIQYFEIIIQNDKYSNWFWLPQGEWQLVKTENILHTPKTTIIKNYKL